MTNKKRRCSACRRWFEPDPRVAHRRFLYCPEPSCRLQSGKDAQGRWLDKNPGYYQGPNRRAKVRRWAKNCPDYWRSWRLHHPDYVERNRQKQKQRNRKRREIAKQDQIAQNPLEGIESIRFLAQINLAKQDQIRLPIEGILDFLAAKERIAKQELMASGPWAGP